MNVRDIPLVKIFITKNVRFETDEELGELIGSVERFTQLQPIGVFPRGERGYELVWGHRRFRAAQMAGEYSIAARILDDIPERDIPLIKLQENMVRKQLSAEEIVKAADELKHQRPGLTDRLVDQMLGKRPGYLSYQRSLLQTYEWLATQGLKKKHLEALNAEELFALKAKLEKRQAQPRRSTYHRGGRTPSNGFEIIVTRGPNIIVVCSCKTTKARVVRYLKRLLAPAEGKKGGAREGNGKGPRSKGPP